MAAIYPQTRQAFLKGDVDLDGTVKVQAVSSAYTYSSGHDFLDDVAAGARLGNAITLAGKTFAAGIFDADGVTLTGLSIGNVIRGLVFYLDTGVEATSRLLYFEDKNADGTAISHTAAATTVTADWPRGGIFSI